MEAIKVMIRVRPLNKREEDTKCQIDLKVNEEINQIELIKVNNEDITQIYTYDYVFPMHASQEHVYETSAFPLVENVTDGYNCTLFAYGQTGCGKTHTVVGDTNPDSQLKGIIPRCCEHLINKINANEQPNRKYLIYCSFIEIYMEDVHDLLSKDPKQKMKVKESKDIGVNIQDLSKNCVKNVDDLLRFLKIGLSNRKIGQTSMNLTSSRSHCIFNISIECQTVRSGSTQITVGKLNLVDLAGSERLYKEEMATLTAQQSIHINLSLFQLCNVISAIVGKHTHVPYRDSKLTWLLRDSLGGGARTVMIGNVSPSNDSFEETKSTLLYAQKVKLIKNQPKVNIDPKDALLKKYEQEIQQLREQLQKNEQITPQIFQQELLQQHALQAQLIAEVESSQLEQKRLSEQLETILYEKEQLLMPLGQSTEEERRKYKQLQVKIKKQTQEHHLLLCKHKAQLQELQMMQQNYNTANQEILILKNQIKEYKGKYNQVINEISFLERENDNLREQLSESNIVTVRENKFLTTVLESILRTQDIEKIRTNSIWRDELDDFEVPPFVLRQNLVKFPQLMKSQVEDLADQDKQQREVTLNSRDSLRNSDSQIKYNQKSEFPIPTNSLKINFYEKKLSNGNQIIINQEGKEEFHARKMTSGIHLQPIQQLLSQSNIYSHQ